MRSAESIAGDDGLATAPDAGAESSEADASSDDGSTQGEFLVETTGSAAKTLILIVTRGKISEMDVTDAEVVATHNLEHLYRASTFSARSGSRVQLEFRRDRGVASTVEYAVEADVVGELVDLLNSLANPELAVLHATVKCLKCSATYADTTKAMLRDMCPTCGSDFIVEAFEEAQPAVAEATAPLAIPGATAGAGASSGMASSVASEASAHSFAASSSAAGHAASPRVGSASSDAAVVHTDEAPPPKPVTPVDYDEGMRSEAEARADAGYLDLGWDVTLQSALKLHVQLHIIDVETENILAFAPGRLAKWSLSASGNVTRWAGVIVTTASVLLLGHKSWSKSSPFTESLTQGDADLIDGLVELDKIDIASLAAVRVGAFGQSLRLELSPETSYAIITGCAEATRQLSATLHKVARHVPLVQDAPDVRAALATTIFTGIMSEVQLDLRKVLSVVVLPPRDVDKSSKIKAPFHATLVLTNTWLVLLNEAFTVHPLPAFDKVLAKADKAKPGQQFALYQAIEIKDLLEADVYASAPTRLDLSFLVEEAVPGAVDESSGDVSWRLQGGGERDMRHLVDVLRALWSDHFHIADMVVYNE